LQTSKTVLQIGPSDERPYSWVGVRGLVLFGDKAQPLLAIGGDFHLVAESHVVLDVLAGHADVVGDLVDPIALLGACQDAGASQAVDGRMIGVLGVDVPEVFFDLTGDQLLPTLAELLAFGRIGEPSPIARAQAVGGCIALPSGNRGTDPRGSVGWAASSASW